MKKLIVGIIAVLAMVAFISPASATNNNKRCQDVHGLYVDCSETSIKNDNREYDNSINNSNTTEIDNSSYNSNRNTNMNTNFNSSKSESEANALSIQGQAQGQSLTDNSVEYSDIQENNQVTEITIKDQSTKIQTIIDFNHIAPALGSTNAELATGDSANGIKTKGIYPSIMAITASAAKRMGKDSTDYRVFDSTLFENDFQTRMISKGKADSIIGGVVFMPTGTAVTADGLFGRAMEYGMKLGATHFEVVEASKGVYHSGSKAGVDFGSSASVAASADGSAVVAPGATMGFSTAWSSNEQRPGLMVLFTFDSKATITKVDIKGLDYTSGK